MCIHVQLAPRAQIREVWDPAQNVITIPDGLTVPFTLVAIRAVLTEMGIPQAALGARCWCGEDITLASIQQLTEVIVSA